MNESLQSFPFVLMLMRHAKSDWSDEDLGDFDRPLNRRGMRDAPRMGEEMVRRGLVPDLMLVSAARRAVMTAELVIAQWNEGLNGPDAPAPATPAIMPRMQVLRDLYLCDPATLLACVHASNDTACARVMVVAHNPGLEETLSVLCGIDAPFPTGALAIIGVPSAVTVSDVAPHGELIDMITPRDLSQE